MARPKRPRIITRRPRITYFKPAGITVIKPALNVKLEELEALRLHDSLFLDEERAAKKMRVSRSTFHRVLISAQRKVTEALVSGRPIKIEGGTYKVIK